MAGGAGRLRARSPAAVNCRLTTMPTANSLQPAVPSRDRLTRRVLEVDIGIDALTEALELITYAEDPSAMPSRERQLLERLGDPRFAMVAGQPVAITTHMKAVGMLLPEVLDVLRKRDIALAVARSGQRMGGVLDAVGEMSEARWLICPKCEGEGELIDEIALRDCQPGDEIPLKDCKRCDRKGKIRVDPNLKAVEIYLGVHGLAKSGGGATINVNATAQAGARADSTAERKTQQQESVTSRVQAMLEGGSTGGSGS